MSGRENSSSSNSARGTPSAFVSGFPAGLNRVAAAPRLADHRLQMLVDRLLVERVDLRRLGESARGDDVPGDRLDRRSLAAGEKDLGSLACKRACDST